MNGLEPKKRVTLVEPPATQQPALKKQRISPSHSNHNDDSDSDEDKPQVDEKLENFRKEAIWRQLQEYKRQFERAQRTVQGLEEQRRKCEIRLSAVEVSWGSLVQEADLLLPSTSTASNGHSSHAASSPSVANPSLSDEELSEALAQRSSATKALLGRLTSLHPTEGTGNKVEELEIKCRELLEQSLRSQESLRLLRLQHDTTVSQLEEAHSSLLRAEKKLDRLQSATVAELEGRSLPGVGESGAGNKSSSGEDQKPSEANGVGAAKGVGGASGAIAVVNGGVSSEELDEWKRLVGTRDGELEDLRRDRIALKTELDVLKGRLVSLPDETIAESTPFKLLQSYVQNLTSDNDVRKSELERVQKEADALREQQESFRQGTVRDATDQIEEIQRKLTLKESDLTRIRAQREEFRAEASELKAKELDKMKSVEEVTRLNQSGKERIEALGSEVRRLKMSLAATRGDGETVDLLLGAEEADVIRDLQDRLKTAENLLLALRDQLHAYTTASPEANATVIADSEMTARAELSTARSRLSKLESLLSPSASGQVELADLAKRLQEKEEQVKVFEAQLKSSEGETNMLYGEVERLSTAWSELDEMCGSKVFGLVGMEEKVQKAQAEKAKADNRYFTTMRQKDALAAENAVLTKLAEKQQRAVEGASDLQHSLGVQLTAAEKEITMHQHSIRAHQDHIANLKRETTELNLRNEQHTKHIAELNALLGQRITQAETELTARKKFEEQCSKQEKDLKAAKAAVMTSSSSSSGSSSAEVKQLKAYNDDLSKMLKCSTCMVRFKGVIINRCGHLFCKECIDARLSNRQRKCPSCGMAFGRDDVSNVYF